MNNASNLSKFTIRYGRVTQLLHKKQNEKKGREQKRKELCPLKKEQEWRKKKKGRKQEGKDWKKMGEKREGKWI